jgi:hypothetical protein
VTLLGLIIGTIVIRYVLWIALWLVGLDFWIMPNLFSDDVPILLFWKPLVTFERATINLKSVLLRVALVGGVVGFLYYDRVMTEQRLLQPHRIGETLHDMLLYTKPRLGVQSNETVATGGDGGGRGGPADVDDIESPPSVEDDDEGEADGAAAGATGGVGGAEL